MTKAIIGFLVGLGSMWFGLWAWLVYMFHFKKNK